MHSMLDSTLTVFEVFDIVSYLKKRLDKKEQLYKLIKV